jgi:hypothetical protein
MARHTDSPRGRRRTGNLGNGGWIPNWNNGFDNQRDFRATGSLAGAELDPGAREYFQQYLAEYFNMEFVHGMGTEGILDALHGCPRAGRWLDLGAGTSTLLWSIPLRGIESVSCCDLVQEALAVLEEFVRGDKIPRCYWDVMWMYGRTAQDLRYRRELITEFLVFDTFRTWPRRLAERSFDLITAIGNFGLCATPEGYRHCFRHFPAHLASGGRVIGADWIRSDAFVREEGHDNTYLSVDLTRAAAADAGLEPVYCERVPIFGDRLYDAVIVWSLIGAETAKSSRS